MLNLVSVILVFWWISTLTVLRPASFVTAITDKLSSEDHDDSIVHGAPEIVTSDDVVFLELGDTWNVICKSYEPIIWIPYAATYSWDPPIATNDVFIKEDSHKPYGASLTIKNATAAVVGRYYCVKRAKYDEEKKDELDEMVAEDSASTLYVYVNDTNQPVVPIGLGSIRLYLKVNQKDSVVIPCKPSHPATEVKLYKHWNDELIEAHEFDPTQGYYLHFNNSEHNDLYFCRSLDNQLNESLFHITAKDQSTYQLLKPSIHTKDHVPLGKPIRLVCSIDISAGEPVSMAWKVPPNNQYAVMNARIKVGHLIVKEHPERPHLEVAMQELTIDAATLEDKGTYRCEVSDHIKHTTYHNYKLHVQETSDDYVILNKEDRQTIINVRRSSEDVARPIHIIIHYYSYPSNITSYWTKDNGQEVNTDHSKYKFIQTDKYLKLTINDPTVYDTGNYTVVAMAGSAHSEYTMPVYVHVKPIVHLDKSKYVKPDETVNFTCRSIGYPPPKIAFLFETCIDQPWKNCSKDPTQSDKWDIGISQRESLIASSRTYQIKAIQPGIVHCKASNSEGSNTEQAGLLVSDLTEPIVLKREYPSHNVTVGDTVTYVCLALGYNYTNEIMLTSNGQKLWRADAVKVKYSRDSYAWEARVTIDNVTLQQSCNISCHVKTIGGSFENKTINLMVKPAVKPWNVAIQTPAKTSSSVIFVIATLSVLLCIGIVLISILYYKMKQKMVVPNTRVPSLPSFQSGTPECFIPNTPINAQPELLPYYSEYEFPRERLKLGKQLGSGEFGVVMKATATGIMVHEDETTVAVKMVNKRTDSDVIQALISELKILANLGQHLNVVNLLGAVTKNIVEHELMVIVEYCRFGNIQNYLQKNRSYFIDQINQETGEINQTIETTDRSDVQLRSSKSSFQYNRSINTTNLVCWASQIAAGMEYLASKQVLHGDLAARNILLCEDNVVKICDFGLARNMYNYDNYKKKSETPIPYKWLALECHSDHVFSTYSDVWAYGIVLWELFSLGNIPYPGIQGNQELLNNLLNGYRMDKPQFSTQPIYDIMLNCWNVKPDSRPSFKDLKNRFNGMLPDKMRNHYMDLNEPYMKVNAERIEWGNIYYIGSLRSPDEVAPSVPNQEQGYLTMTEPKPPVPSRNITNVCVPSGSKDQEKLPKDAPMLYINRLSSVINEHSDGEQQTITPKPTENTSVRTPLPENINKISKRGGKQGIGRSNGVSNDIADANNNSENTVEAAINEKRYWYKWNSRPSFKDFKRRFSAMLPEEFRAHYLELNEPNLEMNAETIKQGATDSAGSRKSPKQEDPPVPNQEHVSEIREVIGYLKMSGEKPPVPSPNIRDVHLPSSSKHREKLTTEIPMLNTIRPTPVTHDLLDGEQKIIIPKGGPPLITDRTTL